MHSLDEIPEIRGLDSRNAVRGAGLIRIPHEMDVPITPRVRQLIDTAEFHRLTKISQLGLVSLVYPAAHHTRFEHSLGVYRNSLLYLRQLSSDERFCSAIKTEDGELLILAALLHDLGHWPFCHPIEDMRLPSVPSHEMFANSFLLEGEVADCLRHDWNIQPRDVTAILSEKPRDTRQKILKSLMSGPIDIDKMDYLPRDSLHAGVPYGRNFDSQRLTGSLCLNQAGDGLALTDKGKTAAEMMVFARYVMFSEVYWHHAVRAATAMLQRGFYLLHGELDLDLLFRMSEQAFIQHVLTVGERHPAADLFGGLFGPTRRLYKRIAEFSFFQKRQYYEQFARRPYTWLAACSDQLAEILSTHISRRIAPHEILFDAPPIKREVEFNVEIHYPKEQAYRSLGEVSPVVKTLAQSQFDDYVKRVRIFVHPRLVDDLKQLSTLDAALDETLKRMA